MNGTVLYIIICYLPLIRRDYMIVLQLVYISGDSSYTAT